MTIEDTRQSSGPQVAANSNRIVAIISIVVLVLVLLCVAGWQLFGEPAKKREAHHAIDAAVEACTQRGRQEFDHRMVEAKLAISELDTADEEIFDTELDNRLIQIGCK